MADTTDDRGVKVRQLLPGQFQHMDEVMKNELTADPKVERARLPGLVWGVVGGKATKAVQETLDCDVLEMLAQAWTKAKELHEYADPAKHPPGEESTVFLGSHPLGRTLHPTLEVIVQPFGSARLKFDVVLEAEFRSAELTIRDGRIQAIGAGDCAVSAQLKYGAVALHKKLKSRTVRFSQPYTLKAPGLPIL